MCVRTHMCLVPVGVSGSSEGPSAEGEGVECGRGEDGEE